jgi:hypothetical protein
MPLKQRDNLADSICEGAILVLRELTRPYQRFQGLTRGCGAVTAT